MKNCNACGAPNADESAFCEACGTPFNAGVQQQTFNNGENVINQNPQNNQQQYNQQQYNQQYGQQQYNQQQYNPNMQSNYGEFSKNEIDSNMGMAILAYIIPLIPFLVEKNSGWVRFHTVQGMNLWIYGLIIAVASAILGMIPILGLLIGLIGSLALIFIGVLDIIGIVNVVKGQAKELPIISKIKIIKQ